MKQGRAAGSWQETPPGFSSEFLGNFLLTQVSLAEEIGNPNLVADYVGNLNLLHQVYGRNFHHRFTELYGSRTVREIYVLQQQ